MHIAYVFERLSGNYRAKDRAKQIWWGLKGVLYLAYICSCFVCSDCCLDVCFCISCFKGFRCKYRGNSQTYSWLSCDARSWRTCSSSYAVPYTAFTAWWKKEAYQCCYHCNDCGKRYSEYYIRAEWYGNQGYRILYLYQLLCCPYYFVLALFR